MESFKNQCLKLLYYLRKRSLNTLEGRQLGIHHVAGRVNDLRNMGYMINTVNEKVGKSRLARYFLIKEIG